jgi:hypothetical protein
MRRPLTEGILNKPVGQLENFVADKANPGRSNNQRQRQSHTLQTTAQCHQRHLPFADPPTKT